MAAAPRSSEYLVEHVISYPLLYKMYDNKGLLCCACANLQQYLDLANAYLEQLHT